MLQFFGFLIVLIIVAVIAVNILIAKKFNAIAREKGHDDYFWWCFLFGIIGWLMVVALPDRRQPKVLEVKAPVSTPVPELQKTEDRLPSL